jgi:arylsulfatase A-like enzyme
MMTGTKFFTGLAVVCGLAASLFAATGVEAESTRPPNIIWIMADDLGYADLGCFGQQRIRTPHLDRMAAEGMKLTSFYAGATVCAPSRCVLMTGLHTGHAYIRGNREIRPMGQWPLPDSTVTVAELLQSAGYSTGLIGKWGLGGPDSVGIPNNQGFDYFFGYLCQRHAHNYYPEFLFRNSDRIFLEGNVVDNERLDGAGYAEGRVHYSHDIFASEALRFVEKNQDRPFFLYHALTIPHANNEGGRRGMEVPDLGEYADLGWPEPQKGHAAMISRMDRDIGRLLDLIRELEIDKQTLVIFTSDNGPHREGGNDPDFNDSNGLLRGIKRDLYEGGIRVPTIAWWPGTIEPGSVSSHTAYFGDLMATAAELAGIEPPDGLDSVSFLPTLTGKGLQRSHPYLYWEFYSQAHRQAVRQGEWKAIRRRDGKVELYHLGNDPGEQNDLSDSDPAKVRAMVRLMDEAHEPSEFWKMDIAGSEP